MALNYTGKAALEQMKKEAEARYARKNALGALATLNEVGEENLTAALKAVIQGKADAATTLDGYGITDGMTATQVAEAIATAIAGADHLERRIVSSTDDIDAAADNADKYIYMVSNGAAEGDNKYTEYMVINGALEEVGNWAVDLSDYAKTTAVATMIANALAEYAKSVDVTSAINEAVSGLIKLTDLSAPVSGAGNVVTSVNYDSTTGVFSVAKEITALTEADVKEITAAEVTKIWEADDDAS